MCVIYSSLCSTELTTAFFPHNRWLIIGYTERNLLELTIYYRIIDSFHKMWIKGSTVIPGEIVQFCMTNVRVLCRQYREVGSLLTRSVAATLLHKHNINLTLTAAAAAANDEDDDDDV